VRILAAPIVFNEEKKIGNVIKRFKASEILAKIDLVVMDDASTDDSRRIIEKEGVKVLSHVKRSGVGASIRSVIQYAKENQYDILVILAGNNKDDPSEIDRLITPIITNGYDFVQGSRYLPGGKFGNLPLYRQIATRFIHPGLFSFITDHKITDSTNGFRAIRLSVLDDQKINLNQGWLDQYELEPYLFYKTIKLGYKVKEVPVTKIYPPHQLGYSKMKPIVGWWSILRPIFLLWLGIKK